MTTKIITNIIRMLLLWVSKLYKTHVFSTVCLDTQRINFHVSTEGNYKTGWRHSGATLMHAWHIWVPHQSTSLAPTWLVLLLGLGTGGAGARRLFVRRGHRLLVESESVQVECAHFDATASDWLLRLFVSLRLVASCRARHGVSVSRCDS